MHDATTNMRQHDHHEQGTTGEGRHGEEIHRRGCCEAIREKRLTKPAVVQRQSHATLPTTSSSAVLPLIHGNAMLPLEI